MFSLQCKEFIPEEPIHNLANPRHTCPFLETQTPAPSKWAIKQSKRSGPIYSQKGHSKLKRKVRAQRGPVHLCSQSAALTIPAKVPILCGQDCMLWYIKLN